MPVTEMFVDISSRNIMVVLYIHVMSPAKKNGE